MKICNTSNTPDTKLSSNMMGGASQFQWTLLLSTALIASANTVTCRFTIDNVVNGVWVNGASVSYSGDPGNWPSVKTFTFDGTGVKRIAIRGSELASNNCGCSCSGLAVVCSSPTVPWWNLVSSTSWQAFGSNSAWSEPPGWQSVGAAPAGFGTPCVTSSGFSLPGYSGYTKIWPSNGAQYASFYLEAGPPTPAPTPGPPPLIQVDDCLKHPYMSDHCLA